MRTFTIQKTVGGWYPIFFLNFFCSHHKSFQGGWMGGSDQNEQVSIVLLQFCPFEPFQTSDYLCASTRKSEREMPKQDAYTDLTSAKTKPMMAKLFYIVKNTLPNKT